MRTLAEEEEGMEEEEEVEVRVAIAEITGRAGREVLAKFYQKFNHFFCLLKLLCAHSLIKIRIYQCK